MPSGVGDDDEPAHVRAVAGTELRLMTGANSTAVAAMVLTIWMAPKTRERSWYFEAITDAHEACESAITEVPR